MFKGSLFAFLFFAVAFTVRAEDAIEEEGSDEVEGRAVYANQNYGNQYDHHDNDEANEVRQLNEFRHLVVTGAFKVIVRLDKKNDHEASISAPNRKVLKNVITEVVDGVLSIRLKDDQQDEYNYKFAGDVEIVLKARNLLSIEANGASSVVVQGAMRGKVIRLTTNGACRISAQVFARKLYSQINGAGVIDVSGKANFASIKIVGSGRYAALNLETEKTKIDIYGSGDLSIWANEKIFGTVEGSAVVVHKDKPVIDVDVNGSAVFRKVGSVASAYEEKVISNIMALQKSFFAGSLVDMS